MNVYGIEISDGQIHACILRMREPFTAADIEQCARAHGVPGTHGNNPVAYRLADRLIQRERKAGRLRRKGKGWMPE